LKRLGIVLSNQSSRILTSFVDSVHAYMERRARRSGPQRVFGSPCWRLFNLYPCQVPSRCTTYRGSKLDVRREEIRAVHVRKPAIHHGRSLLWLCNLLKAPHARGGRSHAKASLDRAQWHTSNSRTTAINSAHNSHTTIKDDLSNNMRTMPPTTTNNTTTMEMTRATTSGVMATTTSRAGG
jgi:hypothetical protein